MDNKSYEIVTRDELVEYIKKNKLKAKYYFRSYELDIEKDFERLCYLISLSPKLISGSKLYFDFDMLDYKNDEWTEFSKMLSELEYGDLIIIESLDYGFGAYTGTELLEYLSKLLNFEAELYILDYDDEQLIKIDIRQLLVYILEALKDDIGRLEFRAEMIAEISNKYYKGKL